MSTEEKYTDILTAEVEKAMGLVEWARAEGLAMHRIKVGNVELELMDPKVMFPAAPSRESDDDQDRGDPKPTNFYEKHAQDRRRAAGEGL